MRQEPDFFGDRELALVYIAKKLKEAQALEGVFTQAGLEFLVEPDSYVGGFLFRSERIGAFFYVSEEDVSRANEVLRTNGQRPYEPGSTALRSD
jgi:hypothetical protein